MDATSKPRVSAAEIDLAGMISASPEPTGTAAMFGRLRKLLRACGPNRHDQVLVLISACITEGVDTRGQIIGTLGHLDFKRGHVAMLLAEGTGTNPEVYRWRRDAAGTYTLLS
ncbi:hypothetical protein [Sphingomonas desiccabilis]|uniref:hypothetical protein n=1 Tax=Sphingomonas desiccabilis TaxID=429134 RepID=UPI001010A169|nr:hypothetical protein [Sphingomonas desiccabilis]MBB3909754.1 hypothetical protein [Sphingomonas desiccabilis]